MGVLGLLDVEQPLRARGGMGVLELDRVKPVLGNGAENGTNSSRAPCLSGGPRWWGQLFRWDPGSPSWVPQCAQGFQPPRLVPGVLPFSLYGDPLHDKDPVLDIPFVLSCHSCHLPLLPLVLQLQQALLQLLGLLGVLVPLPVLGLLGVERKAEGDFQGGG